MDWINEMQALGQLVNESTDDMNYDDMHHNEWITNNQSTNALANQCLIKHTPMPWNIWSPYEWRMGLILTMNLDESNNQDATR